VRLDIVMPAHNEEDRIDRTLRAYRAACPDEDVRFLIALDSCTDRTPEIVHAHEREDRRVRSFEYPKLGKGGVIAETFKRSGAGGRRWCSRRRPPRPGRLAGRLAPHVLRRRLGRPRPRDARRSLARPLLTNVN
jgi:hypothetical protein